MLDFHNFPLRGCRLIRTDERVCAFQDDSSSGIFTLFADRKVTRYETRKIVMRGIELDRAFGGCAAPDL